jgi:hypothetical protein
MNRSRLGQQLRGGGPLGRVLVRAALDERPDLGGQVIQVRRAVDHAVNQCGGGSGAERSLAGGGEGQHGAEAEDVAGRSMLRRLRRVIEVLQLGRDSLNRNIQLF